MSGWKRPRAGHRIGSHRPAVVACFSLAVLLWLALDSEPQAREGPKADPLFLQTSVKGVARPARRDDRALRIRLRGADSKTGYVSTAGESLIGTISTTRFVNQWRRVHGGRFSTPALLSWAGSKRGSGAAVVRLRSPKRRRSSVVYTARILGQPTAALGQFADDSLSKSIPRQTRRLALVIDGLRFDADGCETTSSEAGKCPAGKWNQRRWKKLVGPDRSVDVSTDGLTGTITYYEIGSRSNPTLVLLNGIGTTKTEWDPPFLRDLKRAGYRLIVVDYPGIGTATIDSYANFTVSNLADYTMAMIRGLGLEEPNVLGWAFSGKIAGLMFERYGDELGRYVNIAGHIYNPNRVPIPDNVLANLTSTDPLLAAFEAWPHTPDGIANAIAVGKRVLSHKGEKRSAEFEAAYFNAEKSWQYGDESVDLDAITNPTLIVAGGLDDIAPIGEMKATATRLGTSDVQLFVFNRGAHTVQYQFRTRVVEAIAGRLG